MVFSHGEILSNFGWIQYNGYFLYFLIQDDKKRYHPQEPERSVKRNISHPSFIEYWPMEIIYHVFLAIF